MKYILLGEFIHPEDKNTLIARLDLKSGDLVNAEGDFYLCKTVEKEGLPLGMLEVSPKFLEEHRKVDLSTPKFLEHPDQQVRAVPTLDGTVFVDRKTGEKVGESSQYIYDLTYRESHSDNTRWRDSE